MKWDEFKNRFKEFEPKDWLWSVNSIMFTLGGIILIGIGVYKLFIFLV